MIGVLSGLDEWQGVDDNQDRTYLAAFWGATSGAIRKIRSDQSGKLTVWLPVGCGNGQLSNT